jgi:predicted dehydrogenase
LPAGGPFPARIRDVGVVIDLAPHDVDIMRFLTGLDPIRVYAETEQRIHTEHEDMLFGLLRFPQGITAALEINWLTPTKIRETLVLGEKGMFRVDDLCRTCISTKILRQPVSFGRASRPFAESAKAR